MNIHHEKIDSEFTIIKYIAPVEKGEKILHWHRNVEYFYISEGRIDVELSGKVYHCAKGDVIIIKCGEIHRFIHIGEKCEGYICTFRPELPEKHGNVVRNIKSHITREELCEKLPEENTEKIFEEIYKEFNEKKYMSMNIIFSDIQRLYSFFVRFFEKKDDDEIKSFRGLEDFQAALTFIAENYSEKISLKDVAAKINYNSSYVSTLFVSYTGVNFKAYLDTMRINQAAKLLKNTSERITLIAMKCGYDNIRTFNSAFKRITGVTPREYRNGNNQGER